jgi:hypothetical protein
MLTFFLPKAPKIYGVEKTAPSTNVGWKSCYPFAKN